MGKILITGAGSVQSNGVINSLLANPNNTEEIIGVGSDPMDLIMSNAHKKYLIPYSTKPEYKEALLKVLNAEKPDMIHFQHDLELYQAMKFREEIGQRGVKMFIPDNKVINTCVFKHKSYLKFKEAGIKVPENIVVNNEDDLRRAFCELKDEEGKIWLRVMSIGTAGKGSFPTNDYNSAKGWIDKQEGWGDFVAAEMLTPNSVTWLSIWHEGELVVAQTRLRKGWALSSRSISGVTGITRIGETYSNPLIDEISINSIKAVTSKPHGIFGVDMTYDKKGIPNPTEINISRFFATILFFTEAGLNMPEIFKDIALYEKLPKLEKKINPLRDGLLWIRSMDSHPKLTTLEEINKEIISL